MAGPGIELGALAYESDELPTALSGPAAYYATPKSLPNGLQCNNIICSHKLQSVMGIFSRLAQIVWDNIDDNDQL